MKPNISDIQPEILTFKINPFIKRLWVFLLTLAIGLIAASLAMAPFLGPSDAAHIRIITVIQDILLYIFPAIATAVVITKYPARFLAIESLPSGRHTICAIGAWIASLPLMNAIAEWNDNLLILNQMGRLTVIMREMELKAQAMIETLMGNGNIPSLLLAVAIIGVLAAVSEELIFRGTLQRLLTTAPLNPHTSIWITAIIFSSLHMQFFGFVPRLLLGAYFGYLLYWSKSLWLPILIHFINNTMVVVHQSLHPNILEHASTIGTTGSGNNTLMLVASLIFTTFFMVLIQKAAVIKR